MTTVHIIILIFLLISCIIGYLGKEVDSNALVIAGFILTIWFFVLGAIITNIPKIKHQQLILNYEKAENNLEKFYDKHPEFKECGE